MKTIFNTFVSARLKRQTQAPHASNGFIHCSDKTSSEWVKKTLSKIIGMQLFGLLLMLPYFGMAQKIIRISAMPILPSNLTVEKTVQSQDGNFYVLANGQDQLPYNGEVNITMVYEVTPDGVVLWCNKYGTPAGTGNTSTLTGRAIVVDNGSGNIAIGGYLTGAGTSTTWNNFVMELTSTGGVIWEKCWGRSSTITYGVQDLIFNHDANNPGIVAVSIEWTSSSSYLNNLYLTELDKSTGAFINAAHLTDALDAAGSHNPVGGMTKPRIVESPSAYDGTNYGEYYVVCTRGTGTALSIGFWTVSYNFSTTLNLSTLTVSGPITATGAIEDEGSFSLPSGSGVPTVYICGYKAKNEPVFIEVTNLGSIPPTFTTIDMSSLPIGITAATYLYPTDLTIEWYLSGGNLTPSYALMASVNFLGTYNSGANSITHSGILLYEVPMAFSPAPAYNYNESDLPNTASYGGICTGTNAYTYEPGITYIPYISAGYDSATINVVFVNAAAGPRICVQPITGSSCDAITPDEDDPYTGSNMSISVTDISPDITPISPAAATTCDYVPTGPEPSGGNRMPPAQEPGSENTTSGVNIPDDNGQLTIYSYPNPVTGSAYINITGQIHTTATVSVLDITGQILSNTNATIEPGTNHIAIDMNSLNNGIYILRVSNPDKSINTSVRIEKE